MSRDDDDDQRWPPWPTPVQAFLRAVELNPDAGHSKYMYLGQIHTGQEAVNYYTRGIEVLLADLNKQKPVSFRAPFALSIDGE